MFHLLFLSLLVMIHSTAQAHDPVTRLNGASKISDVTKDQVVVNGSVQADNVKISDLEIKPCSKIDGTMDSIDESVALGIPDVAINKIEKSTIGTLTLHGDATIEESTIGTLIVDAQNTTLRNCVITGDLVVTYNPWSLSNKLTYGTGYSYNPTAASFGLSVYYPKDQTLSDIKLENTKVEGRVIWMRTSGRISNGWNIRQERDDYYFYSPIMRCFLKKEKQEHHIALDDFLKNYW